MVFKASCFRHNVIFADLDKVWISFVHLSAAELICSLNLNLLSKIMPKYFILVICSKVSLCRYILISFNSFRFLLYINITLVFSSLNLILLYFDNVAMLLNSLFENFSTSLAVSPLMAGIRSSANATPCDLVNLRYSGELNWIFQKPEPQQILAGTLYLLLCLL